MFSITHQRSIEAPREGREPPVEYSLDREPWRAFRSSLAVEFTSGRRGGWSADQLSDQAKAEIISGLEARSAVISSYARIQSFVRDFVRNADSSTRSGDPRGAYRDNKDVLAHAKNLIEDRGTTSGGDKAIIVLFDRIELAREAAELVAYGFVTVHEEADGRIRFRFQRWHNRQLVTSKDLESLAMALTILAKEAESRLAAAAEQI